AGRPDRRCHGGQSDSYLLFRADYFGRTGHLAIDTRPAVELPDTTLGAQKAGFQDQLISGNHWLAETQLVRTHEHVQGAFIRLGFHHLEPEQPGRLSHRLDDQYARHDWMLGEVPVEEGLVDRHVLVRTDALGIQIQLGNSV